MKKLMGLSLLFIGCLMLSAKAEASSMARGAKSSKAINYTTTASSVTVSGPAVVYAVILASGTAGTDYTALFDSASIGALAATSITSALKVRVYVSSATQNTIVNFDPPLQFANGLIAANSSATSAALIVYEQGHLLNGY